MSRKYFTVKILYEYWQPSAVGGFGLRLKKASVFWAESGRATDNGGVAWCDMNKNLQRKKNGPTFLSASQYTLIAMESLGHEIPLFILVLSV